MSPSIPGGESGYEPFYPGNVSLDGSVKRFIRNFFEISDDPDRTDEWVASFQDDATVIIGDDVAKGKNEIRKMRRQMWKDVDERKHRLAKVFPADFPPTAHARIAPLDEAEFMLLGAVAYRMKDGGGNEVRDWAAHAQLRRDRVTAPWKFVFYRVYIQK
ncbi:hypothetical protein VTK26DRAFT_8897 [Humicola hyalothermophila]